jgi:sulfur-oxidizing protein SoxX
MPRTGFAPSRRMSSGRARGPGPVVARWRIRHVATILAALGAFLGSASGQAREAPALAGVAETGNANAASGRVPYQVVGDGIPASLTGAPGDPVRGRAIVVERTRGLCVLCHSGPFPDQPFQGNLSPDLAGVGARYSVAQLRLRIVDGRVLNPDTIMPSYYRVDGLAQVAPAFRGRTLLDASEIEDVVAFLATLRDEGKAE